MISAPNKTTVTTIVISGEGIDHFRSGYIFHLYYSDRSFENNLVLIYKRNENRIAAKRYLHSHVHCSIIHNS